MLPHNVDRAAVVRVAAFGQNARQSRVAIGINEAELVPVVLDFDAQPHLVDIW